MRDGLSVLADLVDELEVGGIEIQEASLSRTDGPWIDVDLSVRIAADAEPTGDTGAAPLAGDGDAPETSAARSSVESSAERDTGPGFGPGTGHVERLGTQSVRVGATLGPELGRVQSEATSREAVETPEKTADSSSDDERIPCRVDGCEETFETEHGMKIHATKAHREIDGSGPSPHRDPERLREAYETHETFEEMTEALGVDVTAQTVRRSMMSMGIHEPDAGEDSGGGAGDAGAAGGPDDPEADTTDAGDAGDTDERSEDEIDGPAAEGDESADAPDGEVRTGVDRGDTVEDLSVESPGARGERVDEALPEGVDADVFVTAVREASTLFQVQRAMDMEREAIQSLLAELGLLDVVTGRVATEEARDVSREEVERRILERVGDGEDGGSGDRGDAAVEAD